MAIFQMILFLMAGPKHSRLAKTTQDIALRRHPQGTCNAKHDVSTRAAPWSAPSMPSEAGVVKQHGRP
ncbi:hypothetical protein [Pseudomonas sp. FW300-N2F2]|uniref:hypothetical protein n=1 Tax=Pseudomonas sp. FW300-N2F2 TaxID=2751320 RepID=UPI001A919637|nr:hypothetical protein [Pseudomonas sp. FW300-N2F2]